jgi:alkylation response protein AidB-like acyl-CoA dehydrogenase|tara:strand:- start:198 stop:359 length:162 start_codon:yes stop_codon:yes gene_type:complete
MCSEAETIRRVADTARGNTLERASVASSEGFQIYEGTSQIQRLIISREIYKEM